MIKPACICLRHAFNELPSEQVFLKLLVLHGGAQCFADKIGVNDDFSTLLHLGALKAHLIETESGFSLPSSLRKTYRRAKKPLVKFQLPSYDDDSKYAAKWWNDAKQPCDAYFIRSLPRFGRCLQTPKSIVHLFPFQMLLIFYSARAARILFIIYVLVLSSFPTPKNDRCLKTLRRLFNPPPPAAVWPMLIYNNNNWKLTSKREERGGNRGESPASSEQAASGWFVCLQ